MAVIWRYLRPYRWLCLAAVGIVLLEANCELLLPSLMSELIDEGVRRGDLSRILQTSGAMAAAAAAGIACVLVRNLCSGTASQRFGGDLRRGLFEKLLRLSETGANQIGAGSLATRMMSDSDQLAKSVNSALRIGVKTPVLCLGSVIYALRLDAGLSTVVAVVVAAVLGLIIQYIRLSGQRFQQVRAGMDRVNTVVQEFLRGIRLIKALGREEAEGGRFQSASSALTGANIRLQTLSAWFAPLIALVVNLGIVGLLALAGLWQVEAGKVSGLVIYMTQLLTSLMTLIDVFKLSIRANTAALRIAEVLSLPEEEEPERPEALDGAEPVLEFRKVGFTYPGGKGAAALQDVSFTLRRGEVLAVIGPTGAGKSTLAWLCARLYDPGRGEIRLHGKALPGLSLGDIRSRVVLASQRGSLFSGTIRKNLEMAAPEAAEEQLRAALEDAQCTRFVSEAGGLDAPLEQGGVNLSGGQRQRLMLAQALARGGDALILDDCTSALDPATERRVLEAVGRRKDQAVLLITQRVRSLSLAHRILVLEDGRVLGLGTHSQLLEECPVYREMWATQALKEEAPDETRA